MQSTSFGEVRAMREQYIWGGQLKVHGQFTSVVGDDTAVYKSGSHSAQG